MASQGKTKSDDFRHFCSLCLESYSGRVPKVLPCFHTFCLPCLNALVEKSNSESPDGKEKDGEDKEAASDDEKAPGEELEEEDQPPDQKEDVSDADSERSEATEAKGKGGKRKKTFQCPTCRAPVTIPPGGLSALQTNFYVTMDTETTCTAADKGPPPCEMCEEGHQEDAQLFCHHCQQHMCHSCRRVHDRVTGVGSHRVESLLEPSAPKLGVAVMGLKLCQFHPDQTLCFHCCKCDVTICLHCKLTSHEGHDTQDMATAAVQARGELSGLQARADKQLQLLEACVSRLERDELDLKRQKQEVIQQANARFELLRGWVTRAQDEFLEEVAAKEQATLSEIHMKKASASFFKQNIARKKRQTCQTMSLGADVVLVKNELQAALLKDEAFEDHQKLAERKEHLTFFSSTTEASVLDLNMVRAYIGELTDSSADDADLPSLSFREMALAVSRMKTDLQDLKGKASISKVVYH